MYSARTRKPPRPNKAPRLRTKTIPAPIGGLNGRDPLASMPETDAYELLNLFPGTAGVEVRPPYSAHISSLNPTINSLHVYEGGTGEKLIGFAPNDKKFYELSTGQTVISTVAESDIYEYASCMFSNAGDQYLVMVPQPRFANVTTQTPIAYNGTAISALTMTGAGVSPSSLRNVFGFKGRLYFAQENKIGFFYAPVGAIQGALSYFDLAQVAKRGGKLMAIASYSEDAGSGPDDFIVFITSMGEYIVYQGYDPSNADNWQLVGRYYAAKPLQRRCTFSLGSELFVITLSGILPLSEIMRAGRQDNYEAKAVTEKLGQLFTDAIQYESNTAWVAQHVPSRDMLLFNTPTGLFYSDEGTVFVMNTKTGAWCKFTGIGGPEMVVFNGNLHWLDTETSPTGTVSYQVQKLAGPGVYADGTYGRPVLCICRQAYNSIEDGSGTGLIRKLLHAVRMRFLYDGTPKLAADASTDFNEVDTLYEEWTPRQLFVNGEKGAYYDYASGLAGSLRDDALVGTGYDDKELDYAAGDLSLYSDVAMTTAPFYTAGVAAGGPVAAARDLSGNGNHLIRSAAGSEMGWKGSDAVGNSHNYYLQANATSSDDDLTCAAFDLSGCNVATVCIGLNQASGGGLQYPLEFGYYSDVIQHNSTFNMYVNEGIVGTVTPQVKDGAGSGHAETFGASTAPLDTSQIIIIQFDPSNAVAADRVKLWLCNTEQAPTSSAAGAGGVTDFGIDVLRIGRRTNGGQAFNGRYVGGMAVIGRALTATERDKMARWLHRRANAFPSGFVTAGTNLLPYVEAVTPDANGETETVTTVESVNREGTHFSFSFVAHLNKRFQWYSLEYLFEKARSLF